MQLEAQCSDGDGDMQDVQDSAVVCAPTQPVPHTAVQQPGAAAVPAPAARRPLSANSPGRTPFPTRAKAAAAAAASHAAAAAAATQAAPRCGAAKAGGASKKKTAAIATAHGLLQQYSNAQAAARCGGGGGEPHPGGPPAPRRTTPGSGSPSSAAATTRLLQPTASSAAKARPRGTTPDAGGMPLVVSAAPVAPVAPPARPRPRVASKVVVPSPPSRSTEPSLRSLCREIKSRTAMAAQMQHDDDKESGSADDEAGTQVGCHITACPTYLLTAQPARSCKEHAAHLSGRPAAFTKR